MRRFLILLCILAGTARAEFFLRASDDPVLFLGDSITEQGIYPALLEAYVLTRFPRWDIAFRNVAWSGENVWLAARSGWERGFERDLLLWKPRVVFINLGMNDARGEEGNIPFYIERQTKLARELAAAGARVVLVTPNPEERDEKGEPAGSIYNRMLLQFSRALWQVAEKERVVFIDQLAPYIALIERGRESGVLAPAREERRLMPDAIHPDWPGQLVTATLILKGLDAPALVSRVEIDTATNRVTVAEKARVEWLAAPVGCVRFLREDDALPWPVPAECALALDLPGFDPLGELSRYELKVTGLAAANYSLAIDGVSVGRFEREALAAGVNLSQQAGPITTQARRLLEVVREKNALFFHRWRGVQLYGAPLWLLSTPESEQRREAELARLDGLIAERERELQRLRQPVAHLFELRPE